MDGASRERKVIETETFKHSLAECLRLPGIDRKAAEKVLSAVAWSLHTNPYAWPKFPGTDKLFAAKTCRVTTANGCVPMMRILFTVEQTGDVNLLQIETMDYYL